MTKQAIIISGQSSTAIVALVYHHIFLTCYLPPSFLGCPCAILLGTFLKLLLPLKPGVIILINANDRLYLKHAPVNKTGLVDRQ